MKLKKTTKKKNIETSKEGVNQVIQNLEKEMSDLNAEIAEFARLNKDDQTYIDNLNTDITDLKISVSSFDESGTSLDEMIERIEQDIQNANKNIDSKLQEIENTKQETIKTEEAIIGFEQDIENIKSEVSVAVSVATHYYDQYQSGILTEELAKKNAADQIRVSYNAITLWQKGVNKTCRGFKSIEWIESGDVLSRYINPSREKYLELYGE